MAAFCNFCPKRIKRQIRLLGINQGRNHRENLGATAPMVGRICPPGWNRVKVSENLGATAVAPVAPVDTSLRRPIYPKTLRIRFARLRFKLPARGHLALSELNSTGTELVQHDR